MIENRDALASTPQRELALSCLETGVAACDPVTVIEERVTYRDGVLRIDETTYDLEAYERVLVVGGGKASGAQARAMEEMLGDRINDGVIVTVEPESLERIDVRVGDHPVPSQRGVDATTELLALLEDADEDTLVLALITGGGSALLPAPAGEVSLDDLQSVTQALLESGASIDEINAVRKHLSALKGGGLARTAAPATIVSLLMSDVVGDDLSVIASGPTVPDASTFADATSVLDRYGIDPPASVQERLAAGTRGTRQETPAPGDPLFDRVDNHLTADGATAIRAAMRELEARDEEALFLSSRIRGESREAAKSHVAIAEEIRASAHPVAPPVVMLSGGETTVTIRGDGEGGPNQEFALSAALEDLEGVTVAAMDTDGIDGASPAAGGIVDAATIDDHDEARASLANNDAYGYLRDRRGVIETGPTGTNVNDFRVIVVEAN